MKAVFVVNEPKIAKILVDPMRRTILNLLREKPMTQAQLADELGLSDPSLNYHMKILRKHKLVMITKKAAEEHGIIQKFFSPAAYLFVYDLDSLPKDVARYFHPISIERARSIVSSVMVKDPHCKLDNAPEVIEQLTEKLSGFLVTVARSYEEKEVPHGNEKIVYDIYRKVVIMWLDSNPISTGNYSTIER